MAHPPSQLNQLAGGIRSGYEAGTDEAGRGCLAGPVVAAAVILPCHWHLPGLDDSKKLSPARRQTLAAAIKAQAIAFGYGIIWPAAIDRINILQASLLAMAKAVLALRKPVSILFVDGNQIVPSAYLKSSRHHFSEPRQNTVIHGDALVPCISAASILAKTLRDRIMINLDKRFPQFGFSIHKGYGTALHRKALADFGPSAMHRLSFRGVRPESCSRKALF